MAASTGSLDSAHGDPSQDRTVLRDGVGPAAPIPFSRTWHLVVAMLCLVALIPAYAEVRRDAGKRAEGGMGLDLKWYCQQRYGATSSAINVDRTSDGWRCTRANRLVNLSIGEACRLHYGNTAVDRVAPTKRAGDLYCVLGLNLDWYCKSVHGANSSTTKLAANDPHSWKCRRGGDYLNIGMRDACRRHYGENAIPVLGRHEDPQAWTCEVS